MKSSQKTIYYSNGVIVKIFKLIVGKFLLCETMKSSHNVRPEMKFIRSKIYFLATELAFYQIKKRLVFGDVSSETLLNDVSKTNVNWFINSWIN